MATTIESGENNATPEAPVLQGGAYEIIRRRLQSHGAVLRQRLDQLNTARQSVFGGIEMTLLGTERVLTSNNCVPRDMAAVGSRFLFGYNVQLGLRKEMEPKDVFAVFRFEANSFTEEPLDGLLTPAFVREFKELYTFYKDTRFTKFSVIGPHLFMIFRIGKEVGNVKCFKWALSPEGELRYIDNRSEHEYRFPPQHEFEWSKATRDMHRGGAFPHISFQDRVFVETTGGDLTIKIDDNTATGEGIYSEPVTEKDQTLDDADFQFASVGNLILMRILPYREPSPRYFVYSEKVREARRMDAIAGACVLLPEDHGIIFSNGYYLQTGAFKQFDSGLTGMMYERRIASPNGEDYLYVFYNRESGAYVLLSYNIIRQQVETPIICNGFSLFQDGRLVYFKAQEEPCKSHALQIWQTPYAGELPATGSGNGTLLHKVGNRDVVRCMAGCSTLLGLLAREDSYANLYLDIVRQTTDLLDSFFWIREKEAFTPAEPLEEIKAAAASAIAEYEKVVQLRQAAAARLAEVATETEALLNAIRLEPQNDIQAHVKALAGLRALRGKVISLRELRYMDAQTVARLEQTVCDQSDIQARQCVDFLLSDQALTPYEKRIGKLEPAVQALEKVSQAEALQSEATQISAELEMLIEIVSNLKIDDATHRTRIIDGISALFATLNQVRAALSNRQKRLAMVEGEAEFAAQIKLLNQTVINYLEVCDSPDKCESYLSRVMIQLEEMEGRFADFDDYILRLGEKREEIHNAFETRRLALVEARNRRADTLQRSAERILSSVRTRVAALKTVMEINGYFASDLMIEKLRGIIDQLSGMEDPVKAGDIETKLKSAREDAVRQLHDRLELFDGDSEVIKFGRHRFAVNTRDLELTLVPRGDQMMLHLTGTAFFEPITDPALLATRPVWNQELISETETVARAEFLAYQLLTTLPRSSAPADLSQLEEQARLFMAPRYAEGYLKGVHDADAARILQALLTLRSTLGHLQTPSPVRALAMVFWQLFQGAPDFALFEACLLGAGASNQVFRLNRRQANALASLQDRIRDFAAGTAWFDPCGAESAAAYLYDVIANGEKHPTSMEAGALLTGFQRQLHKLGSAKAFEDALARLGEQPVARFGLAREWLQGYLETAPDAEQQPVINEAAALISTGAAATARISNLSEHQLIEGLRSSHPRITDGKLDLRYSEFIWRLQRYLLETVPRFEAYGRLKKEFLESARRSMRLDEFKPRVLTSFVRNKLIDRVYLPLVGDNLAKQIGVVGKNTRTDRSGMLMLISPPGYGKTTLMEYIANRLGIVFMKINGPAIGHLVTSLDPAEAKNAAAREELHKLGLALEMGDNVMLYVDDIQHCNPEFLQKFISLCDAQRKIEGVYKGVSKTYDFRGKKIAVVMAGNPYTESGEKFRIPDMLANRADTYNLGDILGDNGEDFKLSFLENALTSNPALNRLASGSRHDIHAIIRAAEQGASEGLELEGHHTSEEVSEMLSVMRKLIRIRDVVLRVNTEYIRSAGQTEEYRTEPAFRLQGSYRNMGRLAEKVEAVMNDSELQTLILSDYENEAQTLTTGAEANMLKFKEILNLQDKQEAARWAEIKKKFASHLIMKGVGGDDRVGQAVAQLSSLSEGLQEIRQVLKEAAAPRGPLLAGLTAETLDRIDHCVSRVTPVNPSETALSKATLDRLAEMLETVRPSASADPSALAAALLAQASEKSRAHDALLGKCRTWLKDFLIPLLQQSDGKEVARSIYVNDLEAMIEEIKRVLSI